MKRRDFLKVVGVTGAGVAAAGCSTTQPDLLIPYVVPPEDIVPGMPTYYTTTCRECPAGCGLVVETHEGRATKVEGNPEHPVSRGNTCARGQASVQGLYHPDRLRGPWMQESQGVPGREVSWAAAEARLADRIREAGPGGVVLLSGNYGPTMNRLADEFVRAVGGRRVAYSPFDDTPRDLRFADAEMLVSFGADFLETWGSPVDYAWQFAQSHGYRNGRKGRFVWVGPHRPLTGINADQWVSVKPGTEALVAMAMAGQMDTATAAREAGVDAKVLDTLAQEFRTRRGFAFGPGPATAGRNAAALQSAVDRLNGGRPSGGTPTDMRPLVQLVQDMEAGRVKVLLVDTFNPVYSLPGGLGFEAALARVPTRVSFSSFPDETSAACNLLLPDHHFLEAWDDYQARPDVLALVQPTMRPVFNTKQVGDVLLSVSQRLGFTAMSPGITASTYFDYLRGNWAGRAAGDAFKAAIKRGGLFTPSNEGTGALGFLPLVQPNTPASRPIAAAAPAPAPQPGEGAAPAPAAAAPAPGPQAGVAAAPAPAATYQPAPFEGPGDLHLVVYPSYRFFDGRNANRPWLLELPDPVTKVPWDSWVEIHPETATQKGIRQGDLLRVTSPHGAIDLRAYVYPGVRRDTVAIQMGLGHRGFGRFTEGRGANPMRLLGPAVDPASGAFAPYGVKVGVAKSPDGEGNERFGYSVPDGLFEDGVRLQHDREIARALPVAQVATWDQRGPGKIPGQEKEIATLRGFGGFAPRSTTTDPAQYPPPGTHYGEYIETEARWAMAVDLQRCIGCSACVVACYAENNIPVVGPSEIKRGRALHWLRIERYFSTGSEPSEALSDDATDDVRFLPMLCQHCGNAPCEPVCPVYAAYHTPDGLNGQVYNRCVGTRYCANNCPYKVRYFNWFTYDFVEPLNWQLNPDVTVREKGVMEKCTFCVQRIHEVERNAALADRPVQDGEVVPACVQTCPTEVFVFGNIQDPNSAVARAAASNRSYRVLGELNVQPAVVYLAKVTDGVPKHGTFHATWPAAKGDGPGTGHGANVGHGEAADGAHEPAAQEAH